jgi:DNA-binding HxlR family transcriptional regulator
MARYADYCPIAYGVELLGDRWTPLVIRELMVGAAGFNEIHRGLPRMSRTMLAQRLRRLERRGFVRREPGARGQPGRYTLTPERRQGSSPPPLRLGLAGARS